MSELLVIVSGLPRSGTSLVMQILEAGGLSALTDGLRSADDDNPRGYFEWEAIKKIGQDHRILDKAIGRGKAIKVISTLLPRLPKSFQYKTIFVERDMEEVIRSQQKMLSARGKLQDSEDLAVTARRLKSHNAQIIRWMEAAPHIEVLMIQHRKLIKTPSSEISKIVSFLGQELLPSHHLMEGAVDAKLYRNRNRQGLKSWLSLLRR